MFYLFAYGIEFLGKKYNPLRCDKDFPWNGVVRVMKGPARR